MLNRQVLPLARQAAFKRAMVGRGSAASGAGGWDLADGDARDERPTDRPGRSATTAQTGSTPCHPGCPRGLPAHWQNQTDCLHASGKSDLRTFLEKVWESGLTPENGLKLLISDGGSGFQAAYQRCVFHNLQNPARHLTFAEDQTRQARKELTTHFLRSASAIWQAEDKAQAIERYQTFCAQWQTAQPQAVQTLQRDFETTLAFYDVIEQAKREGQVWTPHLLRTTSRLERMFREFRCRFRQAVLFHSLAGAQAVTAQLTPVFPEEW